MNKTIMESKIEKITETDVSDILTDEFYKKVCENKRAILFINCEAMKETVWFSVFNRLTHIEHKAASLDEAVKEYNSL